MKKLLAIVLLTALAGASIHAARLQQAERVARAAVAESVRATVLTKRVDQLEPTPVVVPGAKIIYEPAALLFYSQPQSMTTRVVAR
jgi:hypothetical protein